MLKVRWRGRFGKVLPELRCGNGRWSSPGRQHVPVVWNGCEGRRQVLFRMCRASGSSVRTCARRRGRNDLCELRNCGCCRYEVLQVMWKAGGLGLSGGCCRSCSRFGSDRGVERSGPSRGPAATTGTGWTASTTAGNRLESEMWPRTCPPASTPCAMIPSTPAAAAAARAPLARCGPAHHWRHAGQAGRTPHRGGPAGSARRLPAARRVIGPA